MFALDRGIRACGNRYAPRTRIIDSNLIKCVCVFFKNLGLLRGFFHRKQKFQFSFGGDHVSFFCDLWHIDSFAMLVVRIGLVLQIVATCRVGLMLKIISLYACGIRCDTF